ncbi:aspartic peptidase domain-containing protein [Mycena epipterygia]|nr:aspartic peptidase domain-containing protein [Mycena epipterygia]
MRVPLAGSGMLPAALTGLAFVFSVAAQQSGFRFPLVRVPRLGQALNGIPVLNRDQYAYAVPLSIGTPPQVCNFVLDTGSSDLWVASTDCNNQDCESVSRFSPWRSSTLTTTGIPFILNYLVGKAQGQIAFDTVQFGPFQVLAQIFATVDETADLGLASTATSGILGLCFPETAAIPATAGATLLENLMSSFDASQRFFAMHLPRTSETNNRNASFTMGALDSVLVPDPTRIAVSSVVRTGAAYDYWKLPCPSFTLDGTPFSLSSSRVVGATSPIGVLDSGTTLILGPSADVAALYNAIGPAARFDAPSGNYQIRCTHAAILGVVLGDPAHEYLIDPADLAWSGGASAGWCTGGVQPNDNVNAGDWLLGDVFMRNVYVVHYTGDQPSIGLLGLTDSDAALAAFHQERGPDVDDGGDAAADASAAGVADGSDGWGTVTGNVKRWQRPAPGLGARVLGAVAGGIGFVVGGMGVVGWRIWRGI